MTVVMHGMSEVDIGPLVVEAMAARPFLRPQYHPLFERLFGELWNTGDVLRQMLRSDLPEDLFVESLVDHTEHEALEILVNRVTFAVYRTAKETDEARQALRGGLARYTHAKCSSDTFYSCATARSMDGKVVLSADRTPFPLPDCDADWCACGWRFLLPSEVERLKNSP